jgi:hypothetical protein
VRCYGSGRREETAVERTVVVKNMAGEIVAEYPDFAPGQAVRVLPAPDGSNVVSAEDGWVFAGPTRHPYAAVIRDVAHNSTVHVDRNRLVARD